MDEKLGNITQALEKEVYQDEQFVQCYLLLDSTIQLVRRTTGHAYSYMEYISLHQHVITRTAVTISYQTIEFKSFIITHLEPLLKLPYDLGREL